MHNVLARCSSNLQFVHNSQANVLLPLINVEVEVHTGKTDQSIETLIFTATPTGVRSVIQTLADALTSFEAVVKDTPSIVSEEEWMQKMQGLQAQMQAGQHDDQIDATDGSIRVGDLNAAAQGIELSEAEVMDSLLNPNVEFEKGD